MGQRFHSRSTYEIEIAPAPFDDAAAVYPDQDIVTRHFSGPATIGDFVTSIAESADGHGGLPTYLRITLHGDATKLRRLMADKQSTRHASKRTAH